MLGRAGCRGEPRPAGQGSELRGQGQGSQSAGRSKKQQPQIFPFRLAQSCQTDVRMKPFRSGRSAEIRRAFVAVCGTYCALLFGDAG